MFVKIEVETFGIKKKQQQPTDKKTKQTNKQKSITLRHGLSVASTNA